MPIAQLGLILLVACIVAMLSRRLGLPYSVGLVTAGLGLALLDAGVELPLTAELIFSVFLPPLVFEAALLMRWKPFSADLPVTLTLAFAGVLVSAAVVAAGMHVLVGWGWLGAAIFGVLIAATDPVSVIAAFREMRVESRLSMVVEAESLLNDGAAAVGFAVLVAIANGGKADFILVSRSLLWSVFGGIAAGGAVAFGILLLAWRTRDHLVEITLTTIAAYASFLLAEHFHMSGVLASMTAGLIVGNIGLTGFISEGSREHVVSFWEYAAFLVNSIIFILIGGHEAHQPINEVVWPALVAIAVMLVGRTLAVYPLAAMFSVSRLRLDMRYQHILVWGGLRGALALALALAVPDSVPEKSAIGVVAFAVVAFSIFVQGLTMPLLVRRMGLVPGSEARPRSATSTSGPRKG